MCSIILTILVEEEEDCFQFRSRKIHSQASCRMLASITSDINFQNSLDIAKNLNNYIHILPLPLLLKRLSCDVLAVSLEVRLTCVGEVKRSEERVVVFGSYSGVGRVKKNPVGAQQLLHRLLQLLLLLDDEG